MGNPQNIQGFKILRVKLFLQKFQIPYYGIHSIQNIGVQETCTELMYILQHVDDMGNMI